MSCQVILRVLWSSAQTKRMNVSLLFLCLFIIWKIARYVLKYVKWMGLYRIQGRGSFLFREMIWCHTHIWHVDGQRVTNGYRKKLLWVFDVFQVLRTPATVFKVGYSMGFFIRYEHGHMREEIVNKWWSLFFSASSWIRFCPTSIRTHSIESILYYVHRIDVNSIRTAPLHARLVTLAGEI